jgi:hypothetical protein
MMLYFTKYGANSNSMIIITQCQILIVTLGYWSDRALEEGVRYKTMCNKSGEKKGNMHK